MSETVRSPEQLGALIQRTRVGRGMSQRDLADLIGTYQKTISAIEKGSPGAKLETMFSLLAALNLDLELVPRRKGSVDLAAIF